MAWIGFPEHDAARSVRPVAQCGIENGYLEQARITWADTERGRGPTGHAIRSGQPCAIQDIAHDQRFAPWRDEAVRRGYASSAAVPLSEQGRVIGALNIYASEADLVKTHAQQGYDILKDVESPWPLAEIVHQHHERIDGSGYPRGLRGRDILLEARILGVADTVEAMSSHRPYRSALGIEAALQEIERGAGVLYDPEVVRSCLKLFAERRFRFEAGPHDSGNLPFLPQVDTRSH